MFKKIPKKYLESIYINEERTPSLYFHKSKITRNFFWKRLEICHDLIQKYVKDRSLVFDFGCGNGVFLPTLSDMFEKVLAADIETRETQKIIEKFGLRNVELQNRDLSVVDGSIDKADVIVALDVLEHFKDFKNPIKNIQLNLKQGRYLITSLPIEGFFTIMTRKISRKEKPWDHYHKGKDVENYIEKNSFRKVKSIIFSRIFPLYLITLWKK